MAGHHKLKRNYLPFSRFASPAAMKLEGFFIYLTKKKMKRVVIYNLKECFESGLTFKDLAEFEERVQDDAHFMGEIAIRCGVFTFSQAKIDKSGRFTLYYDFKTVF